MSQSTSAIESSETVYTFSFTTDWFHTVNAVAATSAPATAASRRGSRAGTQPRIHRSPIKNQHPAAIALVTAARDRKSTRLNSSHGYISYAVFCLKKKKKKENDDERS